MNDDDDLQRLLRASDPGRTLPPLSPARIETLMEHAMTTDTARTSATTRASRRPRRLLVAAGLSLAGAAAAVAIAVPLLVGPAATPMALKAPASAGGVGAACAPVSADLIGRAGIAFRGRVTAIGDGIVTLTVLHRYAGDPGATVTVPQGDDTAVDGADPVFAIGRDYLVAASDRTVLTCGSTGADSPALRAIYDDAFSR